MHLVLAIRHFTCNLSSEKSATETMPYQEQEQEQELLVPEDVIDGCHDLGDEFHSDPSFFGGGHGKERPAPSPLGTVTGSESARKTLRPGGRKALPLCPFA